MIAIEYILAGMLAAATPFLLAALGELVAERSGVLNLGVEGMMITGAICGFAIRKTLAALKGGGPFTAFTADGEVIIGAWKAGRETTMFDHGRTS